jgi:hypothetical protein
MKSFLILSLASSFAFASANADLTLFQCSTSKVIEGKTRTEFSFFVENLNSAKAKIDYWTNEDEEYPVVMKPKIQFLI